MSGANLVRTEGDIELEAGQRRVVGAIDRVESQGEGSLVELV